MENVGEVREEREVGFNRNHEGARRFDELDCRCLTATMTDGSALDVRNLFETQLRIFLNTSNRKSNFIAFPICQRFQNHSSNDRTFLRK